jgi:hypothetical protein
VSFNEGDECLSRSSRLKRKDGVIPCRMHNLQEASGHVDLFQRACLFVDILEKLLPKQKRNAVAKNTIERYYYPVLHCTAAN